MGKKARKLSDIPKPEKLDLPPLTSVEEMQAALEVRQSAIEVIEFLSGEVDEIERVVEAFIDSYSCGQCPACRAKAAAEKEQNAPADGGVEMADGATAPADHPRMVRDPKTGEPVGLDEAAQEFPDLLQALLDSLFVKGAKVVKLDPDAVAKLFGKTD